MRGTDTSMGTNTTIPTTAIRDRLWVSRNDDSSDGIHGNSRLAGIVSPLPLAQVDYPTPPFQFRKFEGD